MGVANAKAYVAAQKGRRQAAGSCLVARHLEGRARLKISARKSADKWGSIRLDRIAQLFCVAVESVREEQDTPVGLVFR